MPSVSPTSSMDFMLFVRTDRVFVIRWLALYSALESLVGQLQFLGFVTPIVFRHVSQRHWRRRVHDSVSDGYI